MRKVVKEAISVKPGSKIGAYDDERRSLIVDQRIITLPRELWRGVAKELERIRSKDPAHFGYKIGPTGEEDGPYVNDKFDIYQYAQYASEAPGLLDEVVSKITSKFGKEAKRLSEAKALEPTDEMTLWLWVNPPPPGLVARELRGKMPGGQN